MTSLMIPGSEAGLQDAVNRFLTRNRSSPSADPADMHGVTLSMGQDGDPLQPGIQAIIPITKRVLITEWTLDADSSTLDLSTSAAELVIEYAVWAQPRVWVPITAGTNMPILDNAQNANDQLLTGWVNEFFRRDALRVTVKTAINIHLLMLVIYLLELPRAYTSTQDDVVTGGSTEITTIAGDPIISSSGSI